MEITVSTLDELERLAEKVMESLQGGEVLALTGELGAGKTAFAKKLLKAAGVKKNVASPTFVLMIPYKSRGRTFYHMDLYRLNGFKDLETLGVPELWTQKENIFLIEWAEKIKKDLPKSAIYFTFEIQDNKRKITIKNAPKRLKI